VVVPFGGGHRRWGGGGVLRAEAEIAPISGCVG
jgi:hypothetical protein